MELNFLGRGSGFNPGEGSTSAGFTENGKLFLIDCGQSVFRILLERKILDSAARLYLLITHTHSDHTGSLGSLILYAYMEKKIPVNIITDNAMTYLSGLKCLLKIFGLNEKMYDIIETRSLDREFASFSAVRFIKTKHCEELDSCGILFETKAGLVFYSGDIRDLSPVTDLIQSGRPIDKIYVDTNSEAGTHHIPLQTLNELIPAGVKSKIRCMHLNNKRCIEEARACGFTVVEL
jgi:ribonuclease BN (tRNA processing enzyme)